MGFPKKALKAGGITALVTYTFFAGTIPIVGKLAGVIVGGAAFLIVETGALIGAGVYLTGKGVKNGINGIKKHHAKKKALKKDLKNNQNRINKQEEASQQMPNLSATMEENTKQNNFVNETNKWIEQRQANPVSITKFSLNAVNPAKEATNQNDISNEFVTTPRI